MDGRPRFWDFLFQLSKVARAKPSMIVRLRSLLLASAFVLSAVAAIVTHYWRGRFEAEFNPRPLFSVISSQFQAWRTDDFGTAYDQASSGAQAHFSLIQYVSKIRTEYGRISRWTKLQFGLPSLENPGATREVYVL